jgi:ABC-type nitrate/sulfonate/bicarbonate transport system substrate-binding protein
MKRMQFLALALWGLIAADPAAAQELKKVKVGYPAFSLTFLTFFVAKDAGIYKKHGLDVDLVQMAGAVQTSALVAGEIDYLTGITSPLVAAARGLPFKGSWSPMSALCFGSSAVPTSAAPKISSAKPSPSTAWRRCKTSSPAI